MISSKEVLETLTNDLLYLEWHVNKGDTIVVESCIRHVGYLEKIINELIKETVDLNKALKHTCEVLENNIKEVEQ